MAGSKKSAPPPKRAASVDNALLTPVVGLSVAIAIVHVVSALPGFSWMWGAHFYAFFPTWELVVATLLLLTTVAAAVGRRDRLVAFVDRVLAPIVSGRRFLALTIVSVIVGTLVFWTARICHTYLGDGNIIVEQIDTSRKILEREPLSSVIQYAVYRTTKPWFDAPGRPIEFIARDALAPASVAAGLLFLVVAWLLALEIARLRVAKDESERRPLAVLVWCAIVLQGYVQLFFGYVENYTFYAVGVVLYLWLAMRVLRGAAPLLLPALALVLCFALHLSSSVLAASFVVLAAVPLAARERRRAALRDLAIAALTAAAVGLTFVKLRAGYNPLTTLIGMVQIAFAHKGTPGYMFSSTHARDFFNEQLLIGPLGIFLFLIAAVMALVAKGARRGTTWFFLVAGAGFLAACWLIGDSNLGYARDWDLLSHSGIVFTVGALALMGMQRVRHTTLVAALVCMTAMSAYHTVPWIATNANEARSLARLKTLPLGLGRTEVVLSTWYRQRGDVDQQRYWLQQALVSNPTNVNAIYLLADVDLKTGRFESAVASAQRAVRMRPEKMEFRNLLVQALYALGRYDEAIPHLESIAQHDPTDVRTAITLAEAYTVTGHSEQASAMFARVEQTLRQVLDRHPDDGEANLLYGFTLLRENRADEAVVYLQKALAINPRSTEGHCFLGYALRAGGHNAEAVEQFRACLTINPQYSARADVESWLATQ